jgi:nucleoid-associated protein YgaU
MANQQDISRALQQSGVSVYGLQVQDAGGRTVVNGTVGTDEDRQKAQQAISRVATDAQVSLQVNSGFADMAKKSAAAGGQRYTVQAGDTLSKIAERFYGKAAEWKKIHEANKEKVPNPDLIHPGDELVIPS